MLWSPAVTKTFTPDAQLAPLLEQMSRDMAVPVEGLVNQALFTWARLHGYAEATAPAPALTKAPSPPEPKEPETTRVPIVEEPHWTLAAGGSFGHPAVADTTAPSLKKERQVVLVLSDREVVVDADRFLVGRDVSCDLTIDSARISRQHAVISLGPDVVELEDLKSSNGTWFEGQRITRRELQDGDEVHFGDVAVRVSFR